MNKLTGPTFFAGVFFLVTACGVAIKRWRNDWLDRTRPVLRWPCTQCPARFEDRDPDRLDKAIHEHWLAHERNREVEG